MLCTRWMTCCIRERGTISKGISMALSPVGGAMKLPICGPQWWRSSTSRCQTSPFWMEVSLDRWPQWFARKPAVNVVGNNVVATGFPGLGAVLRRPAADPPTAWQEWSDCTDRLDKIQLAMHGSGLQRQDFLPPEWHEVLSRASRFPGCAPLGFVCKVWRTWQLGSPTWVDPFAVPAPSRSEALASDWSRAHRSMLAWLDADPEFLLPRTCIVCGDASRNVCGDCLDAMCLDCVANALAQGGPVFGQIFCCSEMAAGEGVRSTAPPLRPSQSRREVAQAIMQFVPPR